MGRLAMAGFLSSLVGEGISGKARVLQRLLTRQQEYYLLQGTRAGHSAADRPDHAQPPAAGLHHRRSWRRDRLWHWAHHRPCADRQHVQAVRPVALLACDQAVYANLPSLRSLVVAAALGCTLCRDCERYGSFLGLNNEAKNVAESQSQLKAKGDFTSKLDDNDIEQARKEGTPADGCGIFGCGLHC